MGTDFREDESGNVLVFSLVTNDSSKTFVPRSARSFKRGVAAIGVQMHLE